MYFGSGGTYPEFKLLGYFGAQFTTKNPKILLKTKISVKTISLGIFRGLRHRISRSIKKNRTWKLQRLVKKISGVSVGWSRKDV